MYLDYNVKEETKVFRAYMYDVIQARFGLCPSATSAARVAQEVDRFSIYPAGLETGLIITVDYTLETVRVSNCRTGTEVAWAYLGDFNQPNHFGHWFDEWCRVMSNSATAKRRWPLLL